MLNKKILKKRKQQQKKNEGRDKKPNLLYVVNYRANFPETPDTALYRQETEDYIYNAWFVIATQTIFTMVCDGDSDHSHNGM